MITRLTLRNFKNVGQQVYDFTHFDLLVGRNNGGKSTVLQALAIWQYSIDEFRRSKRNGSTGVQIVLPNFTALPVPEFNLLWKDRTDRHWPLIDGKKKQEYILISIQVEWRLNNGELDSFQVDLRYHSPQTIYAIPSDGWAKFRQCEARGDLPRIAYVPPFSGLEPTEKWLDISPIRQQVGKAQPGSVLRNLLLWVCPPNKSDHNGHTLKEPRQLDDWKELVGIIERWFSVKIHEPKYDSGRDVHICVEYRQNGKDYDIISGGSGFHQTLTLLAFLYGYQPTTILLDEPDAHLHVNLQREILDYFKRKSLERGTQFLIATHAEEFARGVDPSQIISLLGQGPRRIQSAPEIIRAMAEVSNEEITRLLPSPFILYVEGESDERILRAWAEQCGAQLAMDKIFFKAMGGGGKKNMLARSNEHFTALQHIIPSIKRLMLFDYDSAEDAFHPPPDNLTLAEWKRKNIENYLLVPDAWKRAVLAQLTCAATDLSAQPSLEIINQFFSDQNLTLPPNKTWRDVTANIFELVDGKRILYSNNDSLFQRLLTGIPSIQLIREELAMHMQPEEIHEDVHTFLAKLKVMVA